MTVDSPLSADDLAALSEDELDTLDREVERLLAVWAVKNLYGTKMLWFDDQRLGEKRAALDAEEHPAANGGTPGVPAAVVDSLEGNSLLHPLDTPVIEVNRDATAARALWSSLGVEGLSKFREQPMAIFSIGFLRHTAVRESNGWRGLNGGWLRLTKNEYHAGWVHDMQPTNTRPPLTPEQDRLFLGKYAYRADERRPAVPQPPSPTTWTDQPDETSDNWWLPATGRP